MQPVRTSAFLCTCLQGQASRLMFAIHYSEGAMKHPTRSQGLS